jgi:uncharacterized protein YdeI (YjbR/CyaY-like superfamily)
LTLELEATLLNNMLKGEIPVYYPDSHEAWRKWLEKNHDSHQAVWLVLYTKSSEKKSISWSESVDVALCFGWIDSKKIKIDSEKSHQFFSKRKPKSTWSKINKIKVQNLINNGLMTHAGLKCIEIAKENGSWTLLDEVEELIVPCDLEIEFSNNSNAKAFYLSLSKSMKKAILQWLVLAKLDTTRQKRINEIIKSAEQNLKPRHLR